MDCMKPLTRHLEHLIWVECPVLKDGLFGPFFDRESRNSQKSPLRRRMVEDMTISNLSQATLRS
jgi:hypothetical protein